MRSNAHAGTEGFQGRLVEALRRRGFEVRGDALLEAIGEAVAPRDSLTAGEVDFLVEHGGMSASDFTVESVLRANAEIALAQAAASAEAIHGALSTRDVAALMDTADSYVRRLVAQRKLYVIGRDASSGHRFPTWQFTENAALPGLPAVIAALPENMHPLDVADFMTTEHEDLRGRSPREWLLAGGAPEKVAELAKEFERL